METELSQLLSTLGTIPGLLLIALSCVLMAMKVYSQRLATKAHADHSERILKASPEQLALLEKHPPPPSPSPSRLLTLLLLASLGSNGASIAYSRHAIVVADACGADTKVEKPKGCNPGCQAPSVCNNGKCVGAALSANQSTSLENVRWAGADVGFRQSGAVLLWRRELDYAD